MTPPAAAIPDYIPLLVILLVATILAGVLVGLSWILGPKRPSAEKLAPYECGVTPVGSARERFPVKYYLIAMLFIVFDIETVFLYPWAITYIPLGKVENVGHAMQVNSLYEMVVFIVILFVGYIYVWKKGAFEWE